MQETVHHTVSQKGAIALLPITLSNADWILYSFTSSLSSKSATVPSEICFVPFSDTIKMLGVTLDQNWTLNKHVSLLSRSIHFYIRALRHIIGLPWRSLWLQVLVHLWCNRGWIMPTLLCMECQHLTCANYNLSKILSLVWFCLLFTIFQQVSDSVTSTGFPFTTEFSSKSLHLPIRP